MVAGTLLLLSTLLSGARPTVFCVAPDGKDDNPGTSQQPFATLERARDSVRELRAQSGPLTVPVTVFLRGGVYRVTTTLSLTAEDSGSEAAPIIWQAYPGEEVRLIGGVRLTGWQSVSDPRIIRRLPRESRAKVLQVDLKALGVTDLGAPSASWGPGGELICNSQYMPLARYPNVGEWLKIADVPQGGEEFWGEYAPHHGRFTYDGDRPARWKDTSEIWVHGYWAYDWSTEYHHVQNLDTAKREVWPEPPYHHYSYRKGQRFYFLDVIDELDSPGEWYLDRKTSRLYFWPPCALDKAEVLFPQLQEPMVHLKDAQYVKIVGITFEGSRDRAVVIEGGSHCEIAGCTVRNFGGDDAISVDGTDNGVRSCDIYEVAGIGVKLAGGDRMALTPAHNYVVNCDMHHTGHTFRTWHGAVWMEGVGNRVAHCYVHDLPHQGIGYAGNDHTIEYCDFTRTAQETGDVGVINAGMDWTFMGHEFRYNYFHNVHGPGQLGCFTIYPDLPCGGIHLHGNVFYDLDQGFYTNSGRGMVIENNIFLRCGKTAGFGAWRDEREFKEGGPYKMIDKLAAVHYDQPPYIDRYPILRQLASDIALGLDRIAERALPKDNMIRCNVSQGGLFLQLDPLANLDHVMVEDNLIADDDVFNGSFAGDGQSATYPNGDVTAAEELGKRGNVIVRGDPGLDDLRSQDFRLSVSSEAWSLGFQPIPFDEIGLQVDEYRKTLPLRVSEPLFTPAPFTFTDDLVVHIAPTPQPGGPRCVVRYTLDGSEPSEYSPAYAGPVVISDTTTVKAAAFVRKGDQAARSKTVTATYKAVSLGSGPVYLSDLQEHEVLTYPTCWRKDSGRQGDPITIGGTRYPKGIMLHPAQSAGGKGLGRVVYMLDGALRQAKRFLALVGIDDEVRPQTMGSSTFIVEVHRNGEWERVYESAVVRLGERPQEISVDISGADRLRLLTTDGGDGISCDHAVWADARLE